MSPEQTDDQTVPGAPWTIGQQVPLGKQRKETPGKRSVGVGPIQSLLPHDFQCASHRSDIGKIACILNAVIFAERSPRRFVKVVSRDRRRFERVAARSGRQLESRKRRGGLKRATRYAPDGQRARCRVRRRRLILWGLLADQRRVQRAVELIEDLHSRGLFGEPLQAELTQLALALDQASEVLPDDEERADPGGLEEDRSEPYEVALCGLFARLAEVLARRVGHDADGWFLSTRQGASAPAVRR